MNINTSPDQIVRSSGQVTPGYMSGFGNSFETEALPGALPMGRNSPQRCAYGLYAEQLSGSPFTAPRGTNERSWLYRIRPSVKHSGRFEKVDIGLWRSAPCHEYDLPIAQMRWDPTPLPKDDVTFVQGVQTMTTAGDVNTQAGQEGESLVRDRRRVPAQLAQRPAVADDMRRRLPARQLDLAEAPDMPDRGPHPVQPGPLVGAARRGEGRPGQLLGIEAVGAALRRVLALRQRALQRLGLEVVAEARHVAKRHRILPTGRRLAIPGPRHSMLPE